MRPQQQNRRMRGRGNNNNRRGPNPLTRNYESNGPDVKIRGSAQQIAEKYTNLARDAQSAGDRVMAENYLQHAEHYNRIIAAAQAQMPVQQQMRDNRDDFDDDMMDDEREPGDAMAPAAQPQQPQRVANDGSGPQPVIEGMPVEVALEQEALDRDGEQARRFNGSHQAGEGEDAEGEPRRGRRQRRRGRGGDRGGDISAEAGGSDEGESDSPASESAPRNEAPGTDEPSDAGDDVALPVAG